MNSWGYLHLGFSRKLVDPAVYEELKLLFLPQFQIAEMHPPTKLLCRKMKSQKSVSVYYLRKIRVLLEMSIVNLNQKQNYKCF